MIGQRLIHTALCLVAFAVFASGAQATDNKDPYAPGTRKGPFIATDISLTELVRNGYEIRGNLGTALMLQKGASVYSCMVPPDPEHLSYRTYFVCSELKEKFDNKPEAPKQTLPALKMEQPTLKMEKP